MIQRYLIALIVTISMFSFSNCQQKQAAKKDDSKSKETAAPAAVKKKKAKKASLGKALIRLPREYKKGDIINVKTVITHPQNTGIGKKAKPAHYITSVEVIYGGTVLTTIKTYAALSKDPYFSFKLKAVKSAPLKVIWKDNKGNSFEKSVDVNVGG